MILAQHRRAAMRAGHRPCWSKREEAAMPSPSAPRPSTHATIRHALVAGSLASLLSAGALALAGRRENRSAAAPVNAVSHWYWGDRALRRRRVDARHTLTGYLIHHGASVFWAGLYAWTARNTPALRTPAGALLGSLPTAALACFVDFRLTPSRLTPGFEHRLSRPALTGVYFAFALGLAAGSLLADAAQRRDASPGRRGRPPPRRRR